ncbi:hypothetical protein GCM10027614_00540 [Micromonospora vulcania]
MLEHLDAVTPDAAALGAVNTVVFSDGRAVGHNTDMPGFARSFRTGLADVALDRVVLLGAGGAGAAVAHALLTLGAGSVHILDTDVGRSGALARSVTDRFGTGRAVVVPLTALADELREADGLAHATPTGMEGHPGYRCRRRCCARPVGGRRGVPTAGDATGDRRAGSGCRVLDGGGMAVFQAAYAFELFTGVAPDTGRMLRHFDALVDRQGGGIPMLIAHTDRPHEQAEESPAPPRGDRDGLPLRDARGQVGCRRRGTLPGNRDLRERSRRLALVAPPGPAGVRTARSVHRSLPAVP